MAQYYFEPLVADAGNPPSNAVFVQPWSASSFSSILATATPSVAFTPAGTAVTNGLAAFDEIESVDVSAVKPTQIYGMIWPRGASNSFFVAACGTGSGFGGANGYYVGVNRSSGNLELWKVSGGTRTLLDSVAGAANADFHVLLDITESGSDVILQAKVWQDGSAEPESPTLSYTDTSPITLTGYVGLTQTERSVSFAPELYRLGIGTGGDPAPRSSGGSTAVNFSGTVPTQNLTQDAAMTPLDLSTYFSGTETPFSYAVQTGTLPAGLSLNSSTGVISGTPTATGTASIVVRATDDGSDTADTNSFDIVVAAADVTAPTLSSPSGTQTGSTTADLSVYTNEGNGTLYWVVTTSATSPSVAQVQAGLDHTGAAAADDGSQVVSGTGAQSANATGLTADTTYYVHFQQEDAATNDSTVSTSSSFTTATVAVKGIQLSLKQADGTTAAANLTGLYYHAWDALNPGGASDANGSTETTDGSGVLEININSFSAAIDGEVFLFVYDLDGAEDKDSVCFAGRVPVVDIS